MGTDVHAIWQKKTENGWEDIYSNWDQDRDYLLFAVLADVRNGMVFDPIIPISKPRGFPSDFTLVEDGHPIQSQSCVPNWKQKYYRENDPFWMGDHSYTWLSGKEMLDWYETEGKKEQRTGGFLSRHTYEKWDKKTEPESYCSGIWNKTFVIISEDDSEEIKNADNWTHIQCTWSYTIGEKLSYFFDEVRRLVEIHGEIRLVAGFDS